MPNVEVDNYVASGDGPNGMESCQDVPMNTTMSEPKPTNRRKKEVDPNKPASATLSGRKRVKKEILNSEEDPDELMAVEALAFMCGGNTSGTGNDNPNSTFPLFAPVSTASFNHPYFNSFSNPNPNLLKEEMIAANKRLRVTPVSGVGIPLPPSLTTGVAPLPLSLPPNASLSNIQLASLYSMLPPPSSSSNIVAPMTQQQLMDAMKSMRALTDADSVLSGRYNVHSTNTSAAPGTISTTSSAPAKRPKSASADIYVPLCRAFSRPQVSATQLYNLSQVMDSETRACQTVSQSPMSPPPLTVEFILQAAAKYEHFSPSTIDSWQLALQHHSNHTTDATGFVDSLMSSKDTAVKVIFSLMHCALYLLTEEGQLAWQYNYAKYRQWFKDTLLHVVEMDNVKDEAKNQSLIATLPLAFFCVQKLMPKLGLRDNLCLFLALISCLEGRGKYHGRAGDNLPFAHKCYRYLVEILGGKIFREIPENEQSKADKELSKLFESYTSLNNHNTNTTSTNITNNSYQVVTLNNNNINNNQYNKTMLTNNATYSPSFASSTNNNDPITTSNAIVSSMNFAKNAFLPDNNISTDMDLHGEEEGMEETKVAKEDVGIEEENKTPTLAMA